MPASESVPFAWEPLTPSGVAAFARARLRRLQLVQFIVAILVAAAVVWLLYSGYYPTIRQAIQKMPDEGEIRKSQLDWHGPSPQLLAEGRLLAVSVDLKHTGELRSPADVQIEFGRDGIFIYSLLGYADVGYPDEEWVIGFNRGQMEPWWGAREPALLVIVFGTVVLGLLLLWIVLATFYAPLVWVVGFFANRDLNMVCSWRLAGAALLPGALLMAVGVLLYDAGGLDLPGLGFVAAGHLVLGWIYILVSPFFLPRDPAVAKPGKNPFAPPAAS